jgi:hypothetical protein
MDKKKIKRGIFIMIGGVDIDFPWVGKKWDDGFSGIFDDVLGIIEVLMVSGGAIAVAMIIVGAYIFITSAGNPDKIEQGKKTLTAAIVGLIIVSIVWLIIKFILGDLLNQQV